MPIPPGFAGRLGLTGRPVYATTPRWVHGPIFRSLGMGEDMATNTAPPVTFRPQHQPAHMPVRPRPQRLWQLPTFLLGCAAAVGVWQARPYLKPPDTVRLQRDVRAMREALDRTPPELSRAAALGKHLTDELDRFPQFAGETHYLVGCTHLKRAEEPGGASAEEELAEAKTAFEKAETAGVPEPDQARLSYRLGKVLHRLNQDPAGALDRLVRGGEEVSDDPAEHWRIVAEAQLRVPAPDYRAALDATQKQLALATPATDLKTVHQARLRLAKMHLQLNEPIDARKALQRIGKDAPAEVFFPAQSLLAQCFQAEGDFSQAARCWEQAKVDPRVTKDDLGRVYFELGTCYAKTNRVPDAMVQWELAGQRGGGDGARAAALRSAEQLLKGTDPAKAVPLLEEAFRGLAKPDEFKNELITADDARAVLDQAVAALKADPSASQRVSELSGRLTSPGRTKQVQFDAVEAQAVKALEAAKATTGPAAELAMEEARKLLRQAATAAADAATPDRPAKEQVEWLRKAADLLEKTGDPADTKRRVELLDRVVLVSKDDPPSYEVWFLKAEGHKQMGQRDAALESYRVCLRPDSPYAGRARYQMAVLMLDDPAADLAALTAELEKNLVPEVQQKEAEAYELSMFALGNVLYKKRDFVKAQTRLKAFVESFPASPLADRARFMTGRCAWFLAAKESNALAQFRKLSKEEQADPTTKATIDKTLKTYKDLLSSARPLFEQVEDNLVKKQMAGALSKMDATLLQQASFGAAECYFFQGEYEEAVRRYNLLAIRYAKQVEELVAWSQLWQCHQFFLKQPEKAEEALAQMRKAFDTMPAGSYDGSTPIHKREYWDNWLKQVVRPEPAERGADTP